MMTAQKFGIMTLYAHSHLQTDEHIQSGETKR